MPLKQEPTIKVSSAEMKSIQSLYDSLYANKEYERLASVIQFLQMPPTNAKIITTLEGKKLLTDECCQNIKGQVVEVRQ